MTKNKRILSFRTNGIAILVNDANNEVVIDFFVRKKYQN